MRAGIDALDDELGTSCLRATQRQPSALKVLAPPLMSVNPSSDIWAPGIAGQVRDELVDLG